MVELHNCPELQGELHNLPERVEEALHFLAALEEDLRNCLVVLVVEELRNFLAAAEALVEGDLAVDGKTRHLEGQNEEVEPSLLVVLNSKVA